MLTDTVDMRKIDAAEKYCQAVADVTTWEQMREFWAGALASAMCKWIALEDDQVSWEQYVSSIMDTGAYAVSGTN